MGCSQNKEKMKTVSESEHESEQSLSPLSEMKGVDLKHQAAQDVSQLNHEQIRAIYYYEHFHTRNT